MSANLHNIDYPTISAAEMRHRLIIESCPDGIIMVSAQAVITDISAAAEKILGYPRSQIVGTNILHKVVYPTNIEKAKSVLADLVQTPGKVTLLETKHRLPNGQCIWLEGSCVNLCNEPVVNAIVINFRDVTDRKAAEKKQHLHEEQLSVIYNSTVSPMWLLQVEGDGYYRFKSANAAFNQFFGVITEVVGKLSGEAVPVDNRELLHKNYASVVTSGEVAKFVTTNHTPTGKKTVEVTVVPIKDETGGVRNLLGVVSDMTGQKKANEELKDLNGQLRQLASHLQHVREEERMIMAREVHDELGQQLTVLKMDIAWLNKKLAGSDDTIQAKISSTLELIDTTINTVRKIASELRPSILDNLGLAEAIEWQNGEFYKRTGIPVRFSSNVFDVRFDSEISINLYRIFQESLTNVARHADASEVICILNKTKHFLRLVVEDNGKGFDTNLRRKKQTLGLLGMRERIAMLKGKYVLESKPGKGTCISVKIPLNTMPAD